MARSRKKPQADVTLEALEASFEAFLTDHSVIKARDWLYQRLTSLQKFTAKEQRQLNRNLMKIIGPDDATER